MKLSELALRIGAQLSGSGDIEVIGIAGMEQARQGEVTYLADKGHLRELASTGASAVIVPQELGPLPLPSLSVKNPRLAFAQALRIFHETPYTPGGVSDRAVIGEDAVLGNDLTIHPFAVVADGAKIGSRVTLFPGVFVGSGSSVGDDSVIHPNVSIGEGVSIGSRVIIHSGTVIGSDGFGFVTDAGRHHKIPQVGGVVIEDDVEIGANCAIDRATLGETRIKQGTKLDNLVHIAHNVAIGQHCLLAGQIGIAGSSKLGNYVVIGGQAGIADHMILGDRVMVGGGAGITRNIDPGQVVAGHPAQPLREWLKAQAVFPHLPDLKKRIAELERQVAELKNAAKQDQEGKR